MTKEQIMKKLEMQKIKHEAAIAIRDILEAAAGHYNEAAGSDDAATEDELESGILELVTEEE